MERILDRGSTPLISTKKRAPRSGVIFLDWNERVEKEEK